ncbi:hypothetical protein, partial [uncultured Shewanella sp.]|uniref:hypothetical protein n=1 Tax=uncultured Shewanella sp. TaxID=173975 RepID=UPI00262A3FFE
GKRQKAKGKRQKAKGKRQKAKGKRQKARTTDKVLVLGSTTVSHCDEINMTFHSYFLYYEGN